MKQLVDLCLYYLSNPLINLTVAAIIGALTNVVTSKAFQKEKRIWWSTKDRVMASSYFNKTGKLRLSYKSEKNTYKHLSGSLFATRLVLWNGGKDVINSIDLSSHQTFRFSWPPNSDILEIRPITQTNSSIQIVKLDPRNISVNFEFIDSQQGIIFDVIQSGDDNTVTLSGMLKGGRIESKSSIDMAYKLAIFANLLPKKRYPQLSLQISRWIVTFLLVIILSGGVTIASDLFQKSNRSLELYAMTVQIVIALGVYVWSSSLAWRTPILPKGLEKYYEDIY